MFSFCLLFTDEQMGFAKFYFIDPQLSVFFSSLLRNQKLETFVCFKNQLGYYLAGLIEGDGSIIVPKTVRNEKGKLLYPVIKITFVSKDFSLANKIMEVLGGGSLSWAQKRTYVNLLIQDTKTLFFLAKLVNAAHCAAAQKDENS